MSVLEYYDIWACCQHFNDMLTMDNVLNKDTQVILWNLNKIFHCHLKDIVVMRKAIMNETMILKQTIILILLDNRMTLPIFNTLIYTSFSFAFVLLLFQRFQKCNKNKKGQIIFSPGHSLVPPTYKVV